MANRKLLLLSVRLFGKKQQFIEETGMNIKARFALLIFNINVSLIDH